MSVRAGRKQAMLAALLVLGGLEQANASWIWGGWSAKPAEQPATVTGEEANGPTPTVPDLSQSMIQRDVDEFHLLDPSPTNSSESLTMPTADPKIEEPEIEESEIEVPEIEVPKIEKPKIEEPKIEHPKAEAVNIETPKAEEIKTEEPKAEEPKAEKPAPQVVAPTVAAPSRSWSIWDYIPFVGGSTASQAQETKTEAEQKTVEEAVLEAAVPTIEVTPSPAARVPRVKKRTGTLRRRVKTERRQAANEQASLKASGPVYQPSMILARKATAHKVLGKSANMRSLVLLLESLARDRRVMRYMISGVPPVLRKPGALSDLLVLYGMTELPAGRRSLLVERGAVRPVDKKERKAESWYDAMTEAKIEELLSESMRAQEATLQARAGPNPVVESLSTEEEAVVPEDERSESKKAVDALPATKTRHLHPPKNIPHGQKNPHRLQWNKKRQANDDNSELQRAIMKDVKNWRDLIESFSSASVSEEIDYNDRNIDWEHFIEPVDDAVTEPDEEPSEESSEMSDEDEIGGEFVTKPLNAGNVLRSSAPWLQAAEDKTVYGLRRTPSQRHQAKQRNVAASRIGRQALRASLSKLQRDWRQIYADRFDAPTSSPSTDYDELEYEAMAEEWENSPPAQPSSDEAVPFDMHGFFAKKEKESVELEPFDMNEFFAEPEPKPKARRNYRNKTSKPVSGGHGSQVRSVTEDSGEDSSEQQEPQPIASRTRAGRGRGRGHFRVPSSPSNTTPISMAPGRNMKWVVKNENK